MGLLQDFFGEINSIGKELEDIKQEVVTSATDGIDNVRQTLDETKSNLTEAASEIKETVQDSVQLPGQALGESKRSASDTAE